MKLHELHSKNALQEGSRAEVAKVVLDVLGFVPGAGEIADLSNVALHLQDREYFQAAMSLISIIPEVGDVAGKASKYLYKMLRAGKKFKPTSKLSRKMIKIATKVGPTIRKHWKKAIAMAKSIEKFKPFLRQMDAAVQEFLNALDNMMNDQQQLAAV